MKKNIKYILLALIIIIFFVIGFMVYKNLFAGTPSNRLEGVAEHKMTNNEKNSVKDKLNELENIDSIDIYTNYKIIKIMIKLEEDIDFGDIKNKANEAILNFDENNLAFYDIEIFIESENKESEIYPKIGYKHKSNEKFSW